MFCDLNTLKLSLKLLQRQFVSFIGLDLPIKNCFRRGLSLSLDNLINNVTKGTMFRAVKGLKQVFKSPVLIQLT